jgi:hypothetical protein
VALVNREMGIGGREQGCVELGLPSASKKIANDLIGLNRAIFPEIPVHG